MCVTVLSFVTVRLILPTKVTDYRLNASLSVIFVKMVHEKFFTAAFANSVSREQKRDRERETKRE